MHQTAICRKKGASLGCAVAEEESLKIMSLPQKPVLKLQNEKLNAAVGDM